MKYSQLTARHLFLIDGVGAMLSAFFLGFLLVKYQPLVGMPVEVLRMLASIACVFAIYAFAGGFILKGRVEPFLRWIAIANFIYCLITLILILLFFDEITSLGLAFFILELVIILLLARLELQIALR